MWLCSNLTLLLGTSVEVLRFPLISRYTPRRAKTKRLHAIEVNVGATLFPNGWFVEYVLFVHFDINVPRIDHISSERFNEGRYDRERHDNWKGVSNWMGESWFGVNSQMAAAKYTAPL